LENGEDNSADSALTLPSDKNLTLDKSKITGFSILFAPDSVLPKRLNDSLAIDSSDTSKILLSDSALAKIKQDSTLKADTLFWDSTARMEQFHYQRKDPVYTEFRPKKKSKFFANPSQAFYTRTITLDSTGNFVEVKEKIANEETKILIRIPIDEFIQAKIKANQRDLWEQEAYKYELKSGKKDLSELISDITNIEIPLPSAGFLSIFGPPVINLRIGGAVDIHGAWRSETTEGVTASLTGNTRNEPDFKQQVQINVNGTIGDKLTIGADWNTERTFEYENQLKIKYKGYEDEIVQSVEAGNVSLQTSSLVGGSEALFGVKAQFQLGPLNLTALASQKKGEVKEVSISGGSTSNEFELHAYNYSTNHYFVDEVYADPERNLFNKYYRTATPEIETRFMIKDLEVWKSKTGQRDRATERQVNAYIDLGPRTKDNLSYEDSLRSENVKPVPGRVVVDRFVKLQEGTDYTYNRYAGYITFKTQIQETDAIAVAYITEGSEQTNNKEDDAYYGELIGNDTTTAKRLVLKLVKPAYLLSTYHPAWELQLRNIYSVGGRDVNEEGFNLDIVYAEPGNEDVNALNGQPLLNAFGLDKVSEGGLDGRDGKFDFYENRTINTTTGEIIFPVLQPFNDNFPDVLSADLKYPEIYDTTVTGAKNKTLKDRFLIKGKYSASSTSVFNLGFIGVVENSVKVRLAGRELVEGTDFVVDYNVGQVTIKNSAALVPGADLKISYEQNDLFQMASKTLLGLRGEINFSPKTSLGFSMLNLNQQTLSDKVRIGEEPLDNSIYGLDFGTSLDLPFVTKGLSEIIPTRTMSNLQVKGEFAYINPDPNTKKSTIFGDQGESIAYIDDFEGSKRTIPVGLSYPSWHEPSPPDELPLLSGSLEPNELMAYKAKSMWYTIIGQGADVNEIWPEKQASRQDQQVTVLDYEYWPRSRGQFNPHPTLQNPEQNWGGMMKLLSSTASNLIEENIEFLEFWVKLNRAPANAKIYIDLGKITEDAIPNNLLNSEDKNENDLIDEGEDTGLDMFFNSQEQTDYQSTLSDPSGDDYSFSLGNADFSRINGTEGNAVSIDVGKYPDTEDLNRNLNLDQLNSYFRYEISLDTTKYEGTDVFQNPLITGGGIRVPWYQFRIPLKDFQKAIGDPSFSLVEYIRLFATGLNDSLHLRFAEFNLVGNQWQKVLKENQTEDDVLTLSVVNIEENDTYYDSPPGVQREKDRTKADEDVLRNEQSLSMIVNGLNDGDKREVVKNLRAMDLFNYNEMKLFIHVDDNPANNISRYVDSTNYAAEVFFRFGSDTTNYYEYRMPIKPITDAAALNWYDLSIKFDELTAFKQMRGDSVSATSVFKVKVPGTDGHYYCFKGKPALTKVAFFMIGIENPKGKGMDLPVSGEIWVNELRVIGADDTPGWAYSASAKLNVGDLFTVNYNTSQTDANFHKLSDRFGSRTDAKNWGVSVDFDVLKVLPINLPGSNLRLNYSHNEQNSAPLYQPGTDIKVEEVANQYRAKGVSEDSIKKFTESTKTVSVNESWSVSNFKVKIPSSNWFLKDFVNNLQLGFNYNKSFSRNPTTEVSKTWAWNGNASYSLNFSQNNFFYPANIPVLGSVIELFTDYRNVKIYFTPQSFNWALTASRNYSFSLARAKSSIPTESRDFKTTRNLGFQWKITDGGLLNLSTSYSFSFSSSLAHLLAIKDETGKVIRVRSEAEIWKDIFTKDFFGKNTQFQQSFDLKTSPKLPSLWDIGKYLTLNFGYGATYNWQNNLTQKDLGRSAGVTSKVNASMQFKLKSLFAPWFKEDDIEKETSTKKTTTGRQTDTKQKQTTDSKDKNKQQGRNKRTNDQKVNKPVDDKGPKTDSLSIANNLQTDSLSVAKNQQADSLSQFESAKIDSIKKAEALKDSLAREQAIADSIENAEPKVSPFKVAYQYIKASVRWLLFDYENIQINFSQDNQFQGSGLRGGGSGLVNFWGIFQKSDYGPNRLFMLGLSSNIGPRAIAKGTITDNSSQRNSIDLKTQRPLWEGANLELKWKVGWQNSKSVSISIDSTTGTLTANTPTSTGSITRSFVALPPVFFLPFVKDGIENIKSKYKPEKDNLSEAFSEGFESISLVSKIPFLEKLIKYIPKPNWSINWDGLEKISVFKSWAKRVSISHSYTSEYTEGWKTDVDGKEVMQSQKVNYGFTPLVGLNVTFNQIWTGNLTGNIKYGTKTSYDLGATTKNITETASKDIGISASYSKSGFEIPLFGVSLKNDIEVSFSYTYARNSIVNHIMRDSQREYQKVPQDGTIRTTMEPRIKYVISSKVTLSVFYKKSSVTPEGASKISATSTNEAGLDVHITIQ